MGADSPDGGGLLAPQVRQALPTSLVQALGWLEGRLDEPVELATLAAAAGVRPRTLEAHFRLHLRTTPLGWVRRMRLARPASNCLPPAPTRTSPGSRSPTASASSAGSPRSTAGSSANCRRRRSRRRAARDRARRLRSMTRHCAWAGARWRRRPWSGRALRRGPCRCRAGAGAAPDYALPKAIAAWCWSQRAAHNFSSTPQLDRARAQPLADEAARLAPHDALVLSLCSGALTLTRRLADADRLIERSLALDAWLPWAWIRRGWLSAYAGDRDGAMRNCRSRCG